MKNFHQKYKIIFRLIYIIIISIGIVMMIYYFRYRKDYSENQNKTVYIEKKINGFQLIRNNKPYFIKGVSGIPSNWEMLKQIGANSIRVYDTLNLGAVLDSAEFYDLTVMVSISLPRSRWVNDFYNDSKNTEDIIAKYYKIVRKYKNHPALLAWCLGNELDWPYRPSYRKFYRSYNKILNMIRHEDTNHPITTAIMNFEKRTIVNLSLKVPNLDFISINTFSRMNSLNDDLDDFSWFWNTPFMITEWSVDGYWEKEFTVWHAAIEKSSIEKNVLLKKRFREQLPINNPRFIGHYFFHWGHEFEYSDTWYSSHTSLNKPTSIVQTLNEIFEGDLISQKELRFQNILINDTRNNVFIKPSSTNIVRLEIDIDSTKKYQINWQILDEDWFNWKMKTSLPINSYTNLISQNNKTTTSFIAPAKGGPYRLYVEINEGNGPYSYTNLPFYVVQ